MRQRAKPALGIDVAEDRLSVALVDRCGPDVCTIAVGTVELPRPDTEGAQSIRATVVSSLIARVRRRGTKAAMAISTRPRIMHLLDVPNPIPSNVGDFVQKELKQYVPLFGKEIVSDFCAVTASPSRDRRLLVAAAEEGPIKDAMALCGNAGGAIEAVEPAVLSCARALLASVGQRGRNDHFLIAMLGPSDLEIALFCGGTLDFCRVRSVPSPDAEPELLCRWLGEELKAVTRYYEMGAAGECSDWQGWLVARGGACTGEHLAALTASEAGLQSLAIIDTRQACEDVPEMPKHGFGQGPSLVAVGAAMKMLAPESDNLPINLLPEAIRVARSSSKQMLVAANVAALVFLAMFLCTQLLTQVTGAIHDRIEQAKLSEGIYGAPGLIAREKHVDQELGRLERELAGLHEALARSEMDWPAILHLIGRAVPMDVSITQVASSDNRRIAVRGLTPSCNAVQAFAWKLQEGGPFASVALSRIQKAERDADVMEYQIDCVPKERE